MSHTYPLLQIVPERIRNIRSRVNSLVWEEIGKPLIRIASGEGQDISDVAGLEYTPVEEGSYFAPPGWTHRWFRMELDPASGEEKGNRWLYWNVQGETTLYWNGEPWCGLDIAHPWCPLPDEGGTVYLECGTYQTAVWTMRADEELTPVDSYGLRFHRAILKRRNEKAWAAYHDLDVLVQLMEYHMEKEGFGLLNKGFKAPLTECSPLLRRLVSRLDGAADIFDREGLGPFGRALENIYGDFPAEPWGLSQGIVGNSHIDLVWMWPERITWKKAVHTLSSMVRLSERYPEMVFTMSQPPLMEHIRENAPGLYSEVRRLIAGGRWEATGAMEVEADTLIPCGEALVRSLSVGRKRFAELYGREGDTLWLPDVFGYSQCLPQLCRLSGIENFFTTKMTWSEINKFPHNSFVWESPDGSSVLAHLANCGYVSPMTVMQAVENGNMYRQSDVHGEILLAVGHGDGGGGVTEGQCERTRRMADLATVPRARWTGAEAFFDRLSRVRERLPVYRGEMYLEYHRGTYTSQSNFKANYRKCERAVQAYEAACVLRKVRPEADHAWKRILFAQFHDALPGSSIQEVYDRMNPELESIAAELQGKTDSLLGGSGEGRPSFFNPLATAYDRILQLPPGADPGFEAEQTGEEGDLVFLSFKGPGISGIRPPEGKSPVIEATPSLLDNGILSAEFDRKGRLVSLALRGEALALTGPCSLMIHEDHPVNYEAWDIDRNAIWLNSEVLCDGEAEVIERGPLRSILQVRGTAGKGSAFALEYILEKNSPALKIRIRVDWREEEKLLRYTVPTGYRGESALYGAPFGSVRRSQRVNSSEAAARWEVPGSRWMAVTDDCGKGLGIVTKGKYGFSCEDGRAGISLLRATRTPDCESISKETIFMDRGRHEIEFALAGHKIGMEFHETALWAEILYGEPVYCRADPRTLFSIERAGSLIPSWIAPAEKEGHWLIRFHEVGGDRGDAVLHFAETPESAVLTDLREKETAGTVSLNGKECRFSYTPHQVVTLLIKS